MQGMRDRQDDVIGHAFDLCAFDRNSPVVLAGDHGGENRVQRPISGDHAEVEIDRAEPRRSALFVRAELLAGRSGDETVKVEISHCVDQFGALVWRRQHDDTPEIGPILHSDPAADEDPAERMRDEVHGLAIAGGDRVVEVAHQLLDRRTAGRIVEIHHLVARCGKKSLDQKKRPVPTAETVDQDRTFILDLGNAVRQALCRSNARRSAGQCRAGISCAWRGLRGKRLEWKRNLTASILWQDALPDFRLINEPRFERWPALGH